MKTIHQEENTGPEYFRESWYVMSTLTAAAPQHGETPRTQAFLESPPPCSPAFDVQWLNLCRTWERELNEARADNARLNGHTNWQCVCGGTDCAGQKENAKLRGLLDEVVRSDDTDKPDDEYYRLMDRCRDAIDAARGMDGKA